MRDVPADIDDPAYGFANPKDDTRDIHLRILRSMGGAAQDAAWLIIKKLNELEAQEDQAAAAQEAHDLIHMWAGRLTDMLSITAMAMPCVKQALQGGDLCDQDENLDGRSVH